MASTHKWTTVQYLQIKMGEDVHQHFLNDNQWKNPKLPVQRCLFLSAVMPLPEEFELQGFLALRPALR